MVTYSENNHAHLELRREEPVTRRRSHGGGGSSSPPDDPAAHGSRLGQRLALVRATPDVAIAGYDERLLIKIETTERVSLESLVRASGGVEIVSQENKTLVLAFATEEQLEAFEAKLNSLAQGQKVTYMNVLYALQNFDHWTPDDRMGWALRRDGFPDGQTFVLDVELWPLSQAVQSAELRQAFLNWLVASGGEFLDSVEQPHLIKYRVRCPRQLVDNLLRYRDVRTVDLPPRIGMEQTLRLSDVQQLGQTPSSPENAPAITVLDSGLVSGHPMLAPAVGDAQTFLVGKGPEDEHGHGTLVSGIALYGDVADCIQKKQFIPELRLFSGRILDEHNQSDPPLIENQVDQAVRYFVEFYGCKIFNLSYGDLNKPYMDRHISGLAVTIDALSRELEIAFFVPTGNYEPDSHGFLDWLNDYPSCLSSDDSRLIDPAPALNAVTVGSLARYERGLNNQSYPNDPAYMAIAKSGQPSPFTRHGPSVGGAIKPDLVDYGGNIMVDGRTGNRPMQGYTGVGVLSTSRSFAAGSPFAEDSGTSYATPRVAHTAAKLLAEFPNCSTDLCRAMLVAHARTPEECSQLFADDPEKLHSIAGYGLVDRSALYRSLNDCVTLWTEERIEDRRHHFFEIPMPDDFWMGGRREREITVSLAHSPPVRTTRIEYRAAIIGFKLVQAQSLDQLVRWFNASSHADELDKVKERTGGRGLTETARSRGTVQASTWTLTHATRQMRESSWFVVVTRNDPLWGGTISSERERYALTVTLADRSKARPRLPAPQLYAQVRSLLQIRGHARARGRVGP